MAAKNTLNTMVGAGTVMEGVFNFAGFTRIDGRLTGDIDAKGHLVIGKEARLKSDVLCESLTVGGVLRGDVFAEGALVVLSTGVLVGDCVVGCIKADEGCVINGRITICETKEDWEEAALRYKDKRAVQSGSRPKEAPAPAPANAAAPAKVAPATK